MSLHLRSLAVVSTVLLATGVMAACSSQDPSPNASASTQASAGATASASASASAEQTATAEPTGFPTPDVISPETLSDPSIEYTVTSIPEDLDATQTDILMGFINYDRETWLAVRLMDGNVAAAESTMTGAELLSFQQSYARRQSVGEHVGGSFSGSVLALEVSAIDPTTAHLIACVDQRLAMDLSASGEDVTPPGKKHTFSVLFTLTNTSGSWLVSDNETVGVDTC